MKHEKALLLTGATGFVGRAVATELNTQELRLLSRRNPCIADAKFCQAEISPSDDYSIHLKDVDVIIHAAARVHIMADTHTELIKAFRAVNVDGTLNLAAQAAAAGVKRFIFISSIKVNGEGTIPGKPFTPFDQVNASDPYGISKAQAEEALKKIATETQMEVVIIRPPLIYGPGVKGNFANMINWIKKNIPLPFGEVHNKRSLIALDNLVDFIILCADIERSPKAANQVFVISDGEDVSTTTLLKKVAQAQGRSARLIPIPVKWMRIAARLVGKNDVAERLFGNLQVDSSKATELLGWKPVTTMDEQLKKMFQEPLTK